MDHKRIIALITVSALALSFTGCRARERYLRELKEKEATEPLVCDTAYGRIILGPEWVEAESESDPPDSYTFCLEEYADPFDPPYYLTYTHCTNDYSEDTDYLFANDELQALTEEFGEGNVSITMSGSFNNDTFVNFEIFTEDAHIYRAYRLRDHEHMIFELTVTDEEAAGDVDFEYLAFGEAPGSFIWN